MIDYKTDYVIHFWSTDLPSEVTMTEIATAADGRRLAWHSLPRPDAESGCSRQASAVSAGSGSSGVLILLTLFNPVMNLRQEGKTGRRAADPDPWAHSQARLRRPADAGRHPQRGQLSGRNQWTRRDPDHGRGHARAVLRVLLDGVDVLQGLICTPVACRSSWSPGTAERCCGGSARTPASPPAPARRCL